MNTNFSNNDLFNQIAQLGSHVAALGEMLQWAPEQIQQHTVVALGEILRRIGRDVTECSDEFVSKTR